MGRALPSPSQSTPPEVDPESLEDGDRVVIRAERHGSGRPIEIIGTARPEHERPEVVVEETDPDWTWLLDESGQLFAHEGSAWRRLIGENWSLHRLPATDGGLQSLQSVRLECPDCGARHCRPLRVDPDDPPETVENTCLAPHPMRGADFEGCGETVDLLVVDVKEAGSR